VLCVQQAMRHSGVGLFLDVHGDETIPHVFIDGAGMVPGYGAALLGSERRFCDALQRISPRFSRSRATTRSASAMLSLASKWVAHTYGRFVCR
jgi:hypothetical protein